MYGLTTLARLNREADEAGRIVAAHEVGHPRPAPAAPVLAPAAERLETMHRILDGAHDRPDKTS